MMNTLKIAGGIILALVILSWIWSGLKMALTVGIVLGIAYVAYQMLFGKKKGEAGS